MVRPAMPHWNALTGTPLPLVASTSVSMVRVSLPLTAPSVAVMSVVPTVSGVASPSVPALLLMVATDGVPLVQVTSAVMSCGGPLLYVPVAVNCWRSVDAVGRHVGAFGVTSMESRTGAPPPPADSSSAGGGDRKSTRLNSSHSQISY